MGTYDDLNWEIGRIHELTCLRLRNISDSNVELGALLADLYLEVLTGRAERKALLELLYDKGVIEHDEYLLEVLEQYRAEKEELKNEDQTTRPSRDRRP